ncbi:MAG TPA: hypothetical protein VFK54_12865 [Candidatus Limnocylindrales bacterium]|nr:hypothetical protein [Candidatus Limnocylindrales bacterium]
MAGHAPTTPLAGPPTIPLLSRLYGFGSVFGKTLRDSRRAAIAVGLGMGLTLIAVSQAIVSQFATPASRQEIADLVAAVPPIMQGLAGRPVAVETLGGYLQYKYGTFFPLVASLWSMLALSGTLAGEARRGSLEFVAAGPIPRRRLAFEKLVAHVTAVVLAAAAIFVSIALAGTAFATLPGDEISAAQAAGYAVWLGALGLASGGIAFAVAPFLGRGPALAIAGAVTFAGFILNGYQNAIPELAPFADLTWFGWTADHIPLANLFDWQSVGLVAVVTVVLFAIGIEAFARRDLGATSAVPTPHLPRVLIGVRGPASRAFGEILPVALAWGIGLGMFGLLLAGSGRSFAEQLDEAPEFRRILEAVFPGLDLGTTGALLQLLFVEFGFILVGLAAATIVGTWASDETAGRLEIVLAAPLARARWALSGGLAAFAGIAVVTVLAALGVAIGALITGDDVLTPVVGTLVIGAYGAALVGVGLAIGGLIGTGAAAPVVALLTVATWMIDIIAPPLGLPDAIQQLALTSHYGQPVLGRWDVVGLCASALLALGGAAAGALAFTRRDLAR